jgi:hypothetical protein
VSGLKKKHMTEVRRALRAHALSLGDFRVAYRRSEETALRLTKALGDIHDELGGTSPMADAFAESASRISEADMYGFRCWTEARSEITRIATVLSVPLPKKLTKGYSA